MLGLRQQFAQGPVQSQPISHDTLQSRLRKVLHRRWYLRRLRDCSLTRIAVEGGTGQLLRIIGQPLQQFTRKFPKPRRAKTDRAGHAFPHRHALMGVTGGQVQHVTRLQQVLLLRDEVGQDLQRLIRLKAEVLLSADAPASAPLQLQQKDIVAVKMRPDTTAVGGVAHHHVIEPAIRRKAKALQHVMRGLQMQIHPLHQQRPTRPLQGRQGTPGERALPQPPVGALLLHQSRFDPVPVG